MLSSVMHSERAIQVNIAIMRTFVQLREMIGSGRNNGVSSHFSARGWGSERMSPEERGPVEAWPAPIIQGGS